MTPVPETPPFVSSLQDLEHTLDSSLSPPSAAVVVVSPAAVAAPVAESATSVAAVAVAFEGAVVVEVVVHVILIYESHYLHCWRPICYERKREVYFRYFNNS